jgi:predicted O-methyltransferase YrrM
MERQPPNETWIAVDQFINDHLVPPNPALDEAIAANTAAGLPAIDVTPSQGKLLYLLARIVNARRILEIGTLGGYSTIWLARAMPANGRLITLELDPRHAEIARTNLARAGFTERVEIRVGPALESLETLAGESLPLFDLIFVDADKANNPNYLEWAVPHTRRGGLVIVDNVVRDGAIIDPNDPDPDIQGSRQLFERMGKDPRLVATALQTVGSKGYDGFAIAMVTGDRQDRQPR